MSDHKHLPAPILEQAKFRADVWIKATLGVLSAIVPLAALGIFQDRDPIDLDDEDGWHSDVFWQVALPAFLVWAVVNFSLSRVSTWMGFDMLAESSPSNDLKEAIRTNMTSSGIILALFLTIVVGMLQTDFGVGKYSRNDMWYRLLLVFSIEACVRGLLMVSFFLLYCEPLDVDSAMQFAVDNMLYLGEPVTCIMAVLAYFLFACMVWVFFTDGKYVGIIACAVFGYGLLRSMVVLGYLSSWANPHLDDVTRKSRFSILKDARAADGTRFGSQASRFGSQVLPARLGSQASGLGSQVLPADAGVRAARAGTPKPAQE